MHLPLQLGGTSPLGGPLSMGIRAVSRPWPSKTGCCRWHSWEAHGSMSYADSFCVKQLRGGLDTSDSVWVSCSQSVSCCSALICCPGSLHMQICQPQAIADHLLSMTTCKLETGHEHVKSEWHQCRPALAAYSFSTESLQACTEEVKNKVASSTGTPGCARCG